MRKLTPAEREAKRLARAKQAEATPEVVAEVAPVAEPAPVEVAPAVAEETPAVAEEAPSAETVTEEASDEETPADEKPKRKYTKKADAEAPAEEA